MDKTPSFLRAWILIGSVFALFLPEVGRAEAGYRVFVSSEKTGEIAVIKGGDFQLLKSIPVGQHPRGIQAAPDGKFLYVALSARAAEPLSPSASNGLAALPENPTGDKESKPGRNGEGVGVVDLSSDKFLRTIPAGPDPVQLAVSRNGQQLYVANEDAGTATVTDLTSEKIIAAIPLGPKPADIRLSPDGKLFYVVCGGAGEIFAIESLGYKVIGQMKGSPLQGGLDFLPDGSKAYAVSESAAEIHVFDPGNQTLIKTIPLPNDYFPGGIKVSVDGRRIGVANTRGGTVCLLDTGREEVTENIKVDQNPRGIAFSPDGKFLFTANGSSDDVSIVDLAIGKEVARVKLPAGSNPWGLAVVPTVK